MATGQINRFLKSSMVYGVGNVLNRMLTLLLLPLFTSYLTTAEYGMIGMLALFTAFAQPILQLGTNGGLGMLYFDKDDAKWKNSLIASVLLIMVGSTIVLLLLGLPNIGWIAKLLFGGAGQENLVAITLFTIALSLFEMPLAQKCQLDQRAVPYIVISLTGMISTFSISILCVTYLQWHAFGYLLGTLVGSAVRTALFTLINIKRMQVLGNFWQGIKPIIKVSFPMTFSTISAFMLSQAPKYLLQTFRGLDEVGIYSVAVSLGSAITLLTGAVTLAWSPYFLSFKNRQDEASVLFGKITTYYIIGIGLVCLQFFFFAKPVVWLMVAPEFHLAYQAVGLTALAQLLLGISGLLTPAIYFAKASGSLFATQLIASIITISFGALTIPGLGFLGAGATNTFGYMVTIVIFYFWNTAHRDWFQIRFQAKRMMWVVLFYTSLVIIFSLVHVSTIMNEILIAVLFSCISIGTAWFLLEKDERCSIQTFLRQRWKKV